MKNKKTIIIAIVAILVIAIIAGAIFIINKNAPKPEEALNTYISVSYTHLTLPTILRG